MQQSAIAAILGSLQTKQQSPARSRMRAGQQLSSLRPYLHATIPKKMGVLELKALRDESPATCLCALSCNGWSGCGSPAHSYHCLCASLFLVAYKHKEEDVGMSDTVPNCCNAEF